MFCSRRSGVYMQPMCYQGHEPLCVLCRGQGHGNDVGQPYWQLWLKLACTNLLNGADWGNPAEPRSTWMRPTNETRKHWPSTLSHPRILWLASLFFGRMSSSCTSVIADMRNIFRQADRQTVDYHFQIRCTIIVLLALWDPRDHLECQLCL